VAWYSCWTKQQSHEQALYSRRFDAHAFDDRNEERHKAASATSTKIAGDVMKESLIGASPKVRSLLH
jgi:hypothetical protein